MGSEGSSRDINEDKNQNRPFFGWQLLGRDRCSPCEKGEMKQPSGSYNHLVYDGVTDRVTWV